MGVGRSLKARHDLLDLPYEPLASLSACKVGGGCHASRRLQGAEVSCSFVLWDARHKEAMLHQALALILQSEATALRGMWDMIARFLSSHEEWRAQSWTGVDAESLVCESPG